MIDKLLPPTDNLYKFMAISGLLLIASSFIPQYFSTRLFEWELSNLRDQKNFNVTLPTLNDRLAAILIQYEYESNEYVELLNESMRTADRNALIQEIRRRNIPVPQEAKVAVEAAETDNTALENKIKAKRAAIDSIKLELSKTREGALAIQNDLDSRSTLTTHFRSILDNSQWLANALFLFGIILVLVGFWFWYYRVQRLHDLILTNRAKENATAIDTEPAILDD